MRLISVATVCAITVFGSSAPAAAGEVIRDAASIESFTFEGISLGTPPADALDILLANGYEAGDITSGDQWDTPGVNLVRGSYTLPIGESWITLQRREGRLVQISQTFNRTRGDLFDPAEEIGVMQSHFGIAADDPDCRANEQNAGGSCSIQDAEELSDAEIGVGMTATATMITRAATRPKHLHLDGWTP